MIDLGAFVFDTAVALNRVRAMELGLADPLPSVSRQSPQAAAHGDSCAASEPMRRDVVGTACPSPTQEATTDDRLVIDRVAETSGTQGRSGATSPFDVGDETKAAVKAHRARGAEMKKMGAA